MKTGRGSAQTEHLEDGFDQKDQRPQCRSPGLLINEKLGGANAPVAIHRHIHIHTLHGSALYRNT